MPWSYHPRTQTKQEAMAEQLYPDLFAPEDVYSEDIYEDLLELDEPQVDTPESLVAIPRQTTGQLFNMTGPLLDPATTQSLITALHKNAARPRRPIFVIPGKKREELPAKPLRHQSRHWRLGLTLSTVVMFLAFAVFTMTPLSEGTTAELPVIGGLIQFAHLQQQQFGIFAHPTPPPKLPYMAIANSQYVDIARKEANRVGIPEELFVRQIQTESGFNPNAVSYVGAIGIAQFMPATAAGMGFDPHDPVVSLQKAAEYMSYYYNRNNQDYAKALCAYNAGNGNLDRAIRLGGANWLNYVPAETRSYIYRIMGI
jgi:hypothetical protein